MPRQHQHSNVFWEACQSLNSAANKFGKVNEFINDRYILFHLTSVILPAITLEIAWPLLDDNRTGAERLSLYRNGSQATICCNYKRRWTGCRIRTTRVEKSLRAATATPVGRRRSWCRVEIRSATHIEISPYIHPIQLLPLGLQVSHTLENWQHRGNNSFKQFVFHIKPLCILQKCLQDSIHIWPTCLMYSFHASPLA